MENGKLNKRDIVKKILNSYFTLVAPVVIALFGCDNPENHHSDESAFYKNLMNLDNGRIHTQISKIIVEGKDTPAIVLVEKKIVDKFISDLHYSARYQSKGNDKGGFWWITFELNDGTNFSTRVMSCDSGKGIFIYWGAPACWSVPVTDELKPILSLPFFPERK